VVLELGVLKLILLAQLVVASLHFLGVLLLESTRLVARAIGPIDQPPCRRVVGALASSALRIDVILVEHRVQALALRSSLLRVARFSVGVLVRCRAFVERRQLVHMILVD